MVIELNNCLQTFGISPEISIDTARVKGEHLDLASYSKWSVIIIITHGARPHLPVFLTIPE